MLHIKFQQAAYEYFETERRLRDVETQDFLLKEVSTFPTSSRTILRCHLPEEHFVLDRLNRGPLKVDEEVRRVGFGW